MFRNRQDLCSTCETSMQLRVNNKTCVTVYLIRSSRNLCGTSPRDGPRRRSLHHRHCSHRNRPHLWRLLPRIPPRWQHQVSTVGYGSLTDEYDSYRFLPCRYLFLGGSLMSATFWLMMVSIFARWLFPVRPEREGLRYRGYGNWTSIFRCSSSFSLVSPSRADSCSTILSSSLRRYRLIEDTVDMGDTVAGDYRLIAEPSRRPRLHLARRWTLHRLCSGNYRLRVN